MPHSPSKLGLRFVQQKSPTADAEGLLSVSGEAGREIR